VDEIEPKKGDLIVSRINANIFSLAFQLLKKRIPVRIQGREFGNQLIKIIKDNCEMGDGIESALAAIQEFDSKERDRLAKKTFGERLIDAHSEKVSCLYSLADGCKMVSDMIRTIEQLFSNTLKTEDVVLLSTVHRAKGLEAKTVYFLEPELVPHPMAKLESEKEQEYNLKFVAETRHMETLVYVHERKDEDSRDREEGRELQPECV
jgi:DNA helicase-2/ATP-dependent DNA helicase PcrA